MERKHPSKEKLTALVNEFKELKLSGCVPNGEIHFGDYFICTYYPRIGREVLSKIVAFVQKHNGSIGIHPVKGHDYLSIRISSE